jgi:hypothetical protein
VLRRIARAMSPVAMSTHTAPRGNVVRYQFTTIPAVR